MDALSLARLCLEKGYRISQIDVPDEPAAIAELSEPQLVKAALKTNVIGYNPDKREKYAALHDRAVASWGEFPDSMVGWYTVRTFWIVTEKPNVTLTELVHDRDGLKDEYVEYLERYSDRRKERIRAKCDRFDAPEEIPDGLYDRLLSFVTDDEPPEEVTIEVTRQSSQ